MGMRDGCRAAPFLVTQAFILLVLANACSWIAFTTTSWGFLDDTDDYGLGLWRACSNAGDCYSLDGVRKGWFIIFQGGGALGFGFLNLALVLVILTMFVSDCQDKGKMVVGAGVSCYMGGLSWVVSEVVFAKKWQELLPRNSDCYLSFSFVLAIISSAIGVLAGTLLLWQRVRATKNRTKVRAIIIENETHSSEY